MKSSTIHVQNNLFRRVFRNKKNKVIMDYVSIGKIIPIIAEGEFLGS